MNTMFNSAIKNMYKCLILLVSLLTFAACDINDSLEQEPKEFLTNEAIWNDNSRIVSLLANYYDRLPKHASLDEGYENFAAYTDAMWSGESGQDFLNNLAVYEYSRWSLWDYDLIRDINLAIENLDEFSTEILPEDKAQYNAELRFLRAYMYFELVKRMGGVPIITETIEYDEDNLDSMQRPRNTEEEVYDFISDELDAIVDELGNEESKTRANKWSALALKSRAMLYAGSIADYNNQMANPIETPGGEVGLPAARADDYYQQALNAAEEIIEEGPFALYENTEDLGVNFYEAITNKDNNSEVIWADDYVRPAETHQFAFNNVARSAREVAESSSNVTPTLNLVEAFEYLDGSSGELDSRTGDGSDYIYYDNPEDIFNNKDARLYGTVVYPGSSFRDVPAGLQAGVKVWNSDTQSYETVEGNELGETYEDGGVLTGSGGPLRSGVLISNTGFYLRKYVSDEQGASEVQVQADNWWIFFRLGEIYLNAAEAAFELGNTPVALGYINEVRERAGFGSNSLTLIDLDIDQIRQERRVELAFEDHRVWDLKRWRIAHQIWNGSSNNPEAAARALYPYRVVRPGHPSDGTYVFDKIVAPRFGAPRQFRMGNYYSEIPGNVLNNNPKIVRNPFH